MAAFRALSLLMLLLAGLAGTVGCGLGPSRMVRATAEVPLETDAESPAGAAQRRQIPWTNRELRANVRIELPIQQDGAPLEDIALRAATLRLGARESARADLARQLGRLPAAQPPPGESRDRNLEEFAKARPGMDDVLRARIEAAAESESSAGDNVVLLELRLPLAPIAEEVVRRGGGFDPETPLAAGFGPRARAAAAAQAQANRSLLEQVVALQATGDVTVARWIGYDPTNRVQLDEALKAVRVVRSELLAAEGNKPERWVHEVEFDAKPLLRLVREEHSKREAELKRAREQVKRDR